jgi:hypothetical protein
MMSRHARQYRTETHAMRINLWSMLACAAVLTITAGASAVGPVAADAPSPVTLRCAGQKDGNCLTSDQVSADYTRYSGSGSLDDGANFTCVAPAD